MNFEDNFHALLGREITEEEKQHIQKIKTVLDIRDNDAIWTIILALQYNTSLFKDVPNQVKMAVEEIQMGIRDIAQKETQISQAQLAEAVVKEARTLAGKMDLQRTLQLSIFLLTLLLFFGGTCFFFGTQFARGGVPPLLTVPLGGVLSVLVGFAGVLTMFKGAKLFSQTVKGSWKYLVGGLVCLTISALMVSQTF